MNAKHKILVTGSNGLLGQKLTDLILSLNHSSETPIELVAVSRGPNRHPIQSGYTYIDLNLLDFEVLAQCIAAQQPTCIINTAAMTNVDLCEDEVVECQLLNVDLVQQLIAISEKQNIHLIHLSTDFIFDGENGPYKEEDLPHPLSVYGKSKLASEKLFENARCKWTILRTILVYGVLNDLSRSNIVLWAKAALENEQEIRVVVDQWRMPTLAEDLAAACLSAALTPAYGIYHISGQELMSVYEIVQKIAAFWGLKADLIHPINTNTLNQKAPRPVKTGFYLDKAKKDLNYKPHSFEEGLALVNQQLNQLNHSK
jgi:dTDP-4-dehydrorhamnose reductase